MNPKVSVILPVHNAEAYLPRAFQQLEELEGESVEFIIVNDRSTDSSPELIAAWSSSTKRSHKVVDNGEAPGVASARNLAVREATGTYVWFADCDDDWDAGILHHLLSGVIAESPQIAVCDAVRRVSGSSIAVPISDAPQRETITGKEALRRLFLGQLQGHLWNKLFLRSLLLENPFPLTRAHSDLGGMISLLAAADRVALLPGQMYTYVVREGSILQSREYRWDDLRDCASVAKQTVASMPGGADLLGAVTRFQYSHVVIPLANERVRRGAKSLYPLPFLENFSAATSLSLAKNGAGAVVVRIVFIKYLPWVYKHAYKAFYKYRWGGLALK